MEYFSNNQLKTNPSKTNYINSGLQPHEGSSTLSIVLNNNSFVEEVDSTELPGILWEKALTWEDHIE